MKKIKKSELMVYLFFIIVTFCKGIGLSNSSKVYVYAYIMGIILLIMKIFVDKFSKREFCTIAIILVIGVIDFVIGQETTILFTAIALACMKNIEVDKIMKIMFWTRLISFILVILLSSLGIIDNNIRVFYRATEGAYINRYSFGYTHPNLAHSSFSIIVILFGYVYYKKINIFTISICEILNFILYKFTASRTGFIIITLYLIFIYVTKKIKFFNKKLPKMLNISLVLFIIISFIMAWGYGKFEVFTTLNTILTGRIRFMSRTFNNYEIPIFSYNTYRNITFDNGYFDLIYQGGLLAAIWFLSKQLKTNRLLQERKITRECVIAIFFLFYSITESYYASLLMNPSLLFFTYNIFGTNNNENELRVISQEEEE